MTETSGKYRVLLIDTLIFSIGTIGAKLIGFILVPLYTNTLSVETLGRADLVVTLANLLYPVFSLTIHDALLRFGMSKKYEKIQVISNGFLCCLFSGALTVLCIPFLKIYPPIAEWSWYLVSISILTLINTNLLSISKIQNKNKLYSVASVFYMICLAGANFLFLFLWELEIKGYLLAQIVALVLSIILLLFKTKTISCINFHCISRQLIKEMIWFSGPLTLNNISWWGMNSAGKILIETFVTPSALGLYTVASKIPALQSVLITAFSQAWNLTAIREFEGENKYSFYTEIFKVFSSLLILLTIGILMVIKPLMNIFVGESFIKCWIYVPALLFGNIFYSYAVFLGGVYTAAKKNIDVTITTLLGVVALVLCGIVLTPVLGLWGTIIAIIIGNYIYCLARSIGCRKILGPNARFSIFTVELVITFALVVIVTLDFYPLLLGSVSLAVCVFLNRKLLLKSMDFLKSILCRKDRNG